MGLDPRLNRLANAHLVREAVAEAIRDPNNPTPEELEVLRATDEDIVDEFEAL